MQEDLNEEQRRVESVLRGMKPAETGIARDGLMFAAGRASAGRGRRVWPWQVGMAAAVALCVGMVAMRPGKVTVERVLVMHDVAPGGVAASEKPARMELGRAVEAEIGPGADYLAMRNAVLSRGVDALVSPPAGGGGGTGAGVERWRLEGSEALPAWERRSL